MPSPEMAVLSAMSHGSDPDRERVLEAFAAALGSVEPDRGRAEAKAADVLVVLDARGIGIPDAVRARVTACTDLDQLDAWVRRAVTARSADDLFA